MKLLKSGHTRTIVLALLATGTFVWSAIFMFDVDAAVMLRFFLVSVLGLGVIVVFALVMSALMLLLRRLLQR